MPTPTSAQIKDMILSFHKENKHLAMQFAIEKVCEREGISHLDVVVALLDPEANDAQGRPTDDEAKQIKADGKETQKAAKADKNVSEDAGGSDTTGADSATSNASTTGPVDKVATTAGGKMVTADAAGAIPGVKAESAHDKATTAAGTPAAGTASAPGNVMAGQKTGAEASADKAIAKESDLEKALKESKK